MKNKETEEKLEEGREEGNKESNQRRMRNQNEQLGAGLPVNCAACSTHSSYKSIKRIWRGVGLINLGQFSRPHMAETSALVTKTLV